MVVNMRSRESNLSLPRNKTLACDLHLPVFEKALIEPWPMKMSWENAVRNFSATREHYMQNFDSPEKRLRDKNPEPFRLF